MDIRLKKFFSKSWKCISTIFKNKEYPIVRIYAYVWFSEKSSNNCLILKSWIFLPHTQKRQHMLKISTITKSGHYWIVPSIPPDFNRFSHINFRAARSSQLLIDQHSRAAAVDTRGKQSIHRKGNASPAAASDTRGNQSIKRQRLSTCDGVKFLFACMGRVQNVNE